MTRINTGRPPYQKGQKPARVPRQMRKKSAKRVAYENSPRGQFDLRYMGLVRQLPCVICIEYGLAQFSATQAHHPIHGRFSTAKEDAITCLPLCEGHHTGDFDTSKIAVHRYPSRWKREYGEDHEYIERTQDAVEFFFGVKVEHRPAAQTERGEK